MSKREPSSEDKLVDLKKVAKVVRQNIFWFIAIMVISIFIAFTFLRYSTNIYESNATILITNEKNNVLLSGPFSAMDLFSEEIEAEAEMAIITSRYQIEKVVRNLSLNTKIISLSGRTGLKRTLVYEHAPFTIHSAQGSDSILSKASMKFIISPIDDNYFILETTNGVEQKAKVNQSFSVGNYNLRLDLTDINRRYWNGYKYEVQISPIRNVVSDLRKRIVIDDEKSDFGIIKLSLKGENPEKNNAILNELIRIYETSALDDKNIILENTGEFLQERIAIIEEDLDGMSSKGEGYKVHNGFLSLDLETSHLLLKQRDLEKDITHSAGQVAVAEFIEAYVKDADQELIPVDLGLENIPLEKEIGLYNKELIDLQRLKSTTGEKNPNVLKKEAEIRTHRENLKTSVTNLKRALSVKLETMERKNVRFSNEMLNLPEKERSYQDIMRQQKIKDGLYEFLLQKKEENDIAKASSVANVRVIDQSFCDMSPRFPNKRVVYITAFVIGLLIPSLYFYVKHHFSTRIGSSKEFENYGIPILSTIIKGDKKEKIVCGQNAKSLISESFRMLRTNLGFLADQSNANNQIIMVTSTIPGEGKTFMSINLGHCIANTDKKTVVIGMDLRVPKLMEYMGKSSKEFGLSSYLVDESLSIEDITTPSENHPSLFFIPSGPIPPNPNELLMKPRLEELLLKLREDYDHIIIDTSSVGSVSDTFLLTKFADVTLYVARVGLLNKAELIRIGTLYKNKKLGNMQVVVNGTSKTSESYTYYYYDDKSQKNTTWLKIKNKILRNKM